MQQQRQGKGRLRLLLVAALGLVVLGPVPGRTARAGDLGTAAESLKLVPADTAFYGAWLRNQEQIEAIRNSKAWARLTSLPAVRAVWQMGMAQMKQPGGPWEQFEKFRADPQNQELIALLGDLFAHEVFITGGTSFADFANLMAELNASHRFGRLFAQLQGAGADPNREQIQMVLETLNENRETLKVPDFVLGFELTNTRRATAQLQRLEKLLTALAAQQPQLEGRVKRQQVGGGDFLVVTFDGRMVPWQEIPWEDYEEEPGQYDELRKKLQDLKLAIALGVRDNFLLLSVGESTAPLARLGAGPSLATRPELQPLARFADRKLTSIGYSSEALNARVATTKKDIEDMIKSFKEGLAELELPEEQQQKINKDLEELGKDLQKFLTKPGASLSFTFLTERGHEGYAYDWSEHPSVDASKPLTLLQHVGGSPLLAVVGRSKPSPEGYEILVKWLKKGHGYFEEFALPMLGAETQAAYERMAQNLFPLLGRLDQITRTMLLPSLADGQSGFVLDARVASKQWHLMMPEAEKPLPLLEPALLVGVSDPALLKKAFSKYRQVVNKIIAEVQQLADPNFPRMEIPPPETKQVSGGTLYFYSIPPQLGLDPQLLPNAGVGETVAVLTLSANHSERLLKKTPLQVQSGPLARTNRPLAGAAYFRWAAFIDALAPWTEYGIRQAGDDLEIPEGVGIKDVDDLLRQLQVVFDVLKVFRSYSSVTYVQDKALVTHSVTDVQDLK